MKRHFYITLLFLLFVATLAAQTYPVRTITMVTPPYPATLEDFYANGGNKLNIQISVNDLALSNYPVKFRIKLLGPGVDISSDPNFVPKPFLLNGGETYNLSGADLTAYFNPDNLIFTGYSKTQYQRTGRLPDGVYRLSLEVLFYNNSKISIASTVPALIWLSQNEPPLLNFPANQEVISAISPQNIMLNWTMRQSPFSTPSFSPEYKFDLWEIWPDEKNPNDIAQSTRPIYTTTITNTSLIYTVNEPLLFVGRRYAWRIQVIDPDGNARFTNNGYSEVRWFRFGKVCPVPVLKLDTTGISHIAVKWDGDYHQNKFQVRYREKNKKDAEWYTSETTNVSLDIKNLKPATSYELQVCGYCDDQLTDYSNIVSAQTTTETNFACGAAPATPDLSQPKLLEKLNPKDYIKAGDFDVQVSSATGSNGNFTGKGVVLVPYLKYLRVAVTFKNIKVNEDHRLTNGVIYTVYDLNNSLILKTGNPSFLQVNPNKTIENNDFKKVASITMETDTTVRDVEFTKGVITVTDDKGNITHARADSSDIVAITNKDNPNQTQYVADVKTQTVYSAKPETYGTNANTASAVPQPKSGGTQYNVTFVRHNLENYGFDAPSTTTPAENYESVTIDGKPQLIPWKSVEAGKFDRVKAKVAGGSVDSVHFRRESEALVMTAPGTTDTTQLMLSGQGDMDEDKVFAWYPEYTKVNDSVNSVNRVLAGQLNMTSYEKKKLTVYLVPVNGSTYPENLTIVQAYLNRIYAPALVEWTVKPVTNFRVSINGTEAQKIDNSSLDDQMNYTADMKVVTDAFQTNTNYNNDSYYLFFLNDGTDQNIKGYMPFNKQFGFIFKYKQGLDAYLRTIAHELGHGPFRLYHTFSDKNKYVQTQGSTNNLMDYVDDGKTSNALNLQKYQWDEVHSWHLGANWLESGDEVASIKALDVIKGIQNAELIWTGRMTCITPAGKPYTLPSNIQRLDFTPGQLTYVPNGALVGFVLTDGTAYVGVFYPETKEFLGYAKLINASAEKDIDKIEHKNNLPICRPDNETKNLSDNDLVYIGYQGDCVINLYTTTYSNVKKDGVENAFYFGSGPMNVPISYTDSKKVSENGFKDNSACPPVPSEPLVKESFEPFNFDLAKVPKETFDALRTNAVHDFSILLQNAAGKYPFDKNHYTLYSDNFYHIVNSDVIQNEEGKKFYKMLEHKLQYLKKRTDIEVYVVFNNVNFLLSRNTDDNNKFAKDVFDAVKDKLPAGVKDKIVVITVPYVNLHQFLGTDDRSQYVMAGVYDPNRLIANEFYSQKQYTNSYDLVYNAYKYISKPLDIYYSLQHADGTISYEEKKSTNKVGFGDINKAVFLRNPSYDSYMNMKNLRPIRYGPSAKDESGIEDKYSSDEEYALAICNWEMDLNDILASSQTIPLDEWVDMHSLTQIHNIIENYIPVVYRDYAVKQAFTANGFVNFWNDLRILYGSSYNSEDKYKDIDLYCYNYSKWEAIDPIVYTVIDITGIAFDLTDGLGLIYAMARGDVTNIEAYTISLAVVGVSALVVKGAIKLVKGTKVLFKGSIYIVKEGNAIEKIVIKQAPLKRLFKMADDAVIPEATLTGLTDLLKQGKITEKDVKAIWDAGNDAKKMEKAATLLENNLLTIENKFIDNLLENDYQKYLLRKSKQAKSARTRLDWKEARDYWMNDSPLARGNKFNDKAKLEGWYPYDEVHLSNGKRVDSYKPPTEDGQVGEIISRKATNLEEIELSTFESYLMEMKTKYSPGTAINSPKYGEQLKGKVLEGKQILEIPTTNQSFDQIQEYIDLAKNKYNIEIRFKSE